MISLLKKLGFGETVAALIMLIFGVVILLNAFGILFKNQNIIGILIATYLILIGLLKLLTSRE